MKSIGLSLERPDAGGKGGGIEYSKRPAPFHLLDLLVDLKDVHGVKHEAPRREGTLEEKVEQRLARF